jgi:hypothetical protein
MSLLGTLKFPILIGKKLKMLQVGSATTQAKFPLSVIRLEKRLFQTGHDPSDMLQWN